jgi:hypothetical protein
MADMTSPIPGDDDEISEGSEMAPNPCFEVEGNAELVVLPRSEVSDEEVVQVGIKSFWRWRCFQIVE